mgnify:FL=1
MTNRNYCSIISTEQEKNTSQKGKLAMKNMTSAIWYMSESQAIVEQYEYSLVMMRPYQDKQGFMLGLAV